MSPLGQEKRFLCCTAKTSSCIPLHKYQEFLTSIGKSGFLPSRIKMLDLYSSTSPLYQAIFNVCIICHLTYQMSIREPSCKRFTVFFPHAVRDPYTNPVFYVTLWDQNKLWKQGTATGNSSFQKETLVTLFILTHSLAKVFLNNSATL